MNQLFLDALNGTNRGEGGSHRPPIWLMRQAGRYMASYQKIRTRTSFMEMCTTPELIAEVTLLPIQEFGFDAAIVFSDILLIAKAMGRELTFEEGVGPVVAPALSRKEDIAILQNRDILEKLEPVLKGISILKKELSVPLLGFAGAPFTVASYMIEGRVDHKKGREMRKTKEWMYEDPKSFHALLEVIADYTVVYLNEQIRMGVDAIQLFESSGHILPFDKFEEFSLRYLRSIFSRLNKTKKIAFCRGSSMFYKELATVGADCLSLDWQAPIHTIRQEIGSYQKSGIALQGNLDPDILLQSRAVVEKEAKKMILRMQHDPAYICNLGHGILPTTPEENVKALVEVVKSFT